MKSQLLLRPTNELKEQLRAIAKRNGQTMNQLAVQILRDWVKRNDPDKAG